MSLQDSILAALKTEKKPVTQDRVLELAKQTLEKAGAGKEARDFAKWFETNGAWLTRKINA